MTIAAFALKLTQPVVAIIAVNSDLEVLKKELDRVNRSYVVAGSSVISHPTNLDDNIVIQLNTQLIRLGLFLGGGKIKFNASIVKIDYQEDVKSLSLIPPQDNAFNICIETTVGKRLCLGGSDNYESATELMRSLARENIIDILDRAASPIRSNENVGRIAGFVRNKEITDDDINSGKLQNLFVCQADANNIFKYTRGRAYYEVRVFDKTRVGSDIAIYDTFNPEIVNIMRKYYSDGFKYDISNIEGYEKHTTLHKLLSNSISGMIKDITQLENIQVRLWRI